MTAALRTALAFRTRRAIKMKFFLRPDMEEDPEIWNFPDSSKLRHSKVELDWKVRDLYALLLVFLANDEHHGGAKFREDMKAVTGVTWRENAGVYPLPEKLEGETQLRPIVEGIADKLMGKSPKRGYTYSWIPTHLADAAGRISPRTFLLTFKRAAELTHSQHAGHEFALHYEALQQGVAHASDIRIKEIAEDYPWVGLLLKAARGLSVPMERNELVARWTADQISGVHATGKLPPRRFTTDPIRNGRPEVLVEDLVELSVVYRTEDDRLNIPDIFRVGFGIKRKGGVRPPRKG
jgi:hypothetical protein